MYIPPHFAQANPEELQRIIRAHHGRIDVESHVGRGTRFRIWIPGPPQVRLLAEPTP